MHQYFVKEQTASYVIMKGSGLDKMMMDVPQAFLLKSLMQKVAKVYGCSRTSDMQRLLEQLALEEHDTETLNYLKMIQLKLS